MIQRLCESSRPQVLGGQNVIFLLSTGENDIV
nr:MAG TPA: hypothetical protein [Caudoviricetes sp.]